jgi:hypothetical protein
MKYVVYHVASTMEKKSYKSASLALAYAEKLGAGYAVASAPYYAASVVKMVEKVNMMSGLPYMEASNTPSYCSPSSESYWSM